MIGYTMVGTNDLKRAISFYDPLMAEMGLDRCYRDELSTSWGRKEDDHFPLFFVGYPFDGELATVGNGVMTAFRFDNNAALVDRLYAMALDNGGSDEGAPGFRPQYGEGFYAAYVRDLDGNKLAFVCYDAEPVAGDE
ncbi:VOC family protein [Phyllobacterium lublinensis]|uniref:VOC family protein n=1 Tax=Phyllobacterium lublinensis TaxID=2875708 RepID=UPI001CCA6625|nr:VOC family protein [Phyllobacterium sp. 2063]MBZ9655842.1 VOC family protein [Phyllobacterium sp. 2063]